jgi:predicted nucleotidyltransferase
MNWFSRINPEVVRERLNNLKSIGAKFPVILAVYLFGSFAQGRENELSDVDVAVLLSNSSRTVKGKIEVEVGHYLEVDEVDIVFLDEAPLAFVKEIINNSQRVYCRDTQLTAEFEADVLVRYFDLEPLLGLYDETQITRIRNGGLGENVYQTRSATVTDR